jgi:hypothetical protein
MATIKLIQNNLNSPANSAGAPVTLCDDEAKNFAIAQIRAIREADISEIKKYCGTYKRKKGNFPVTNFKKRGLLAANFPAEDVSLMLDQNKGNILFLRVYLGINETGDHILCMAPIDMNKQLITIAGTIYTTQCCGVPPNEGNFKGDPILGL